MSDRVNFKSLAEWKAYERGMLDGGDQILEQDEPLRAERDALAARVRELEDALREVDKWLSDAAPQMVEYDHGVPYDVVGCALESARAALAPTQRDT